MRNRPAYGIDSVDHALRLATFLQQEGPLRVTDAAERLGVARSTAHRLLAMLVYRDFAEQDADRRYIAGPVLHRQAPVEPVADLRHTALPHLHALVECTDETANLQIVTGHQVRFVATVECDQVLRVGDREGRMLPAHLASGGRAVLATRTDKEITDLYSRPESSVSDLPTLLRDLRRIRRQGFAVNNQATETGVTAIGRAVRSPDGTAVAGVSIAMPTVRYSRDRLPEWVQNLSTAISRIEDELASAATRP